MKPEVQSLRILILDCNPGPVEYSGNVATVLLGHHWIYRFIESDSAEVNQGDISHFINTCLLKILE